MALFNSVLPIKSRYLMPTMRTKFVSPTGPPIVSAKGCRRVITLFDRRAHKAKRHAAIFKMTFVTGA